MPLIRYLAGLGRDALGFVQYALPRIAIPGDIDALIAIGANAPPIGAVRGFLGSLLGAGARSEAHG